MAEPDDVGDQEVELGGAAAGCRTDRGSRGSRRGRPARAAACGTCARASGARRRMTSMQKATAAKAVRVPALASAASSSSGTMPASAPTITAVNRVIRTGEPRPDTRARLRRQQAVARHDEEDPALAVEEGEDHGRQRDHRRGGEIARRPRAGRARAGSARAARGCRRSGCRRARRSRRRRPPCR